MNVTENEYLLEALSLLTDVLRDRVPVGIMSIVRRIQEINEKILLAAEETGAADACRACTEPCCSRGVESLLPVEEWFYCLASVSPEIRDRMMVYAARRPQDAEAFARCSQQAEDGCVIRPSHLKPPFCTRHYCDRVRRETNVLEAIRDLDRSALKLRKRLGRRLRWLKFRHRLGLVTRH